MQYCKKPILVDATQWFMNGDHPKDDAMRPFEDTGKVPDKLREGKVVRYYRNPDDNGQRGCEKCGKFMHDHGWIDTLEGGHVVCPGDWIITGIANEMYPCKPGIFEATYDLVDHAEEETVELPVTEPEDEELPLLTEHHNIILGFENEIKQVVGKLASEITAYASELFFKNDALEKQLDNLAKKILSYDCGLPCANKEHPDGMSAVEAAIVYMDNLRKELDLKVGDWLNKEK